MYIENSLYQNEGLTSQGSLAVGQLSASQLMILGSSQQSPSKHHYIPHVPADPFIAALILTALTSTALAPTALLSWILKFLFLLFLFLTCILSIFLYIFKSFVSTVFISLNEFDFIPVFRADRVLILLLQGCDWIIFPGESLF